MTTRFSRSANPVMTYRQQARRRWRRACWIDGDGPFAVLAHCRVLSVSLHPSREAAERTLRQINRTGCGGCCTNWHSIVALADE